MLDNDFSIKRASELLDCSTQNIYRQKDQLIKQGYMKQSETGSYYITEPGINFLREKRIETMQANSKDFKQVVSQDLTSIANQNVSIDTTNYIQLLQDQIKDLKNEKEYWKQQYENKDQELKEKNSYIQELNTKAFALLGTAEQNQKQEEETKKGFFKRFFK